MAWVAGDRPGDLIRVVAGLQIPVDDEVWVRRLGPALGLTRFEDVTESDDEPLSVPASTRPRRSLVVFPRSLMDFLRSLGWSKSLGGIAGILVALLAIVAGAIVSPLITVAVAVLLVLLALYRTRDWWMPWFGRVLPLQPQSVLDRDFDLEEYRAPPPPPQLVPDNELRSVVHALACVVRPSSRLDLHRVLKDITLGRSVLPLHRLRTVRLAPQVEVLIDRSDPMAPLATDVEALVERMQRVVGTDRIKVLSFRTIPEDGVGDGPVWTWIPYSTSPPVEGSRIVIVSDAGAGLPSALHRAEVSRRWDAVAETWVTELTPAILLTPFAIDSYASAFDEILTIVTWNEHLTARGILQKVKSRS